MRWGGAAPPAVQSTQLDLALQTSLGRVGRVFETHRLTVRWASKTRPTRQTSENVASACGGDKSRDGNHVVLLARGQRQPHVEARAAAGLALHLDPAAEAGDDLMDHGQPQPRAALPRRE